VGGGGTKNFVTLNRA